MKNENEDVMLPALVLKNLCKTWVVDKRQNHVLRNISLSIEQGEMAAVMGPSGSGKTTLLHTASGIERMTAGEAVFFGRDIAEMNDNEIADLRLNEMGFVFQQMYMLKNLSVQDNILLPAWQAGKGKKAARQQKEDYCRDLMYRMGINTIAADTITRISGGQLQRAGICRGLINNPRMIFADEPTGNLNKQASAEVMKEFLRVSGEGMTIMLVTHDVRVAARCDRVLYIIDGQINDHKVLGKYTGDNTLSDRERTLNSWLVDLEW